MFDSLGYDTLGRLSSRWSAAATINFIRDSAGDLTRIEDSVHENLVVRTYDDLGRPATSTHYNPTLASPQQATVTRVYDYDAMGRLVGDEATLFGTQVGVDSTWSTNASGYWERESVVTTPGGSTNYIESFNNAGQLVAKSRVLATAPNAWTNFHYIGDLYVGREQSQLGWMSPFRESRELDALGRVKRWSFSAVDVNASGSPLSSQDGTAYCGSTWDAAICGQPLLAIDVVRDVAGRIASLHNDFGHPVWVNGTRTGHIQPKLWRGYAYDPMGRLSRTWEDERATGRVDTTSLMNHYVTETTVAAVGASLEEWKYDRELTVGGTTKIWNVDTGTERWAVAAPRTSHMLDTVRSSSGNRTFGHDDEGRITTDGNLAFHYDPLGMLSSVTSNGALVEAYAYDADGRMVARFDSSWARKDFFAHDGLQVIASVDASGNRQWEASWGPGLDQLLEWRRLGANPEEHIPLADHRQSIVGTWRPDLAQVNETAEYNPEGRLIVRAADGTVTCDEQGSASVCPNPNGVPFGFTGAWRSEATGMVYMRNRWYSPESGQFLSHDPLGFVDSFNLYAYVAFDPINGWDPFGLETKPLAEPKGPETWIIVGPLVTVDGRGGGKRDETLHLQQQAVETLAGPVTEAIAGQAPAPALGRVARGIQIAKQVQKGPGFWGWIKGLFKKGAPDDLTLGPKLEPAPSPGLKPPEAPSPDVGKLEVPPTGSKVPPKVPPSIGHPKPWAQMTQAERSAFQHSYSRHGQELGLPKWSQKKAEELRKQFNAVVGYIRETGVQVPGPIYKPWNGSSVEVNFFESTLHGTKYYYYEEAATGIFISAGKAR